jgi:hypothetical protein
VTITKAMTIKCQYTEGGVLVAGTNGIVVNAGATDAVTLRGLDILGVSNALNGVRFIAGKSLKILDSEIYGFTQNGVDFEPNTANARLVINNSHIHDNTGNGVLVAPAAGGTTPRGHLRNNLIEDNGCGATVTDHGANTVYSSRCGTNAAGAAGTGAKLFALNNAFIQSDGPGGHGLMTNGPTAIIVAGDDQITNNSFGVENVDGGASGGVYTFTNNYVDSNTTNGTFRGTVNRT